MESRVMPHVMLVAVFCLGHVAMSLGDDQIILAFSNDHRRVHELFVSWNISTEYELKHVEITNQKDGGESITFSGPLIDVDSYLIEDLNSETGYEVCIKVVLDEADGNVCGQQENMCGSCVPMSTIKLVRDDSLIGAICTLGSILGLVLLGYLCWYCAKKKAEKNAAEKESEYGSDVS